MDIKEAIKIILDDGKDYDEFPIPFEFQLHSYDAALFKAIMKCKKIGNQNGFLPEVVHRGLHQLKLEIKAVIVTELAKQPSLSEMVRCHSTLKAEQSGKKL